MPITNSVPGWHDLEKPWQACFALGWESFRLGSIPIGAVVVNENGDIISKGRNMLFEDRGESGTIARHKIAHAELNAILGANEFNHPNIRKYTIYSTTEPCPMCFGTIVMANIRNVKYAARDRLAGGTGLNDAIEYIRSKKIRIAGPVKGLEEVQITLHTVFEIMKNPNYERLLSAWRVDCPAGVDLGIMLAGKGMIQDLARDNRSAPEVYRIVADLLNA